MALIPASKMYGCTVKGKSPLFYQRWCFSHYREVRSAPPREAVYRMVSDALLPGYHEWHIWTERAIEAYCNNTWCGISGCSSCVAGETRILMADTGEAIPIKELCEKGIAPRVMTLHGPRQASVPWVRGVAPLFEIRLANGSCFRTTAKHRVLVYDFTKPGATFECVENLHIGQRFPSYGASPLGPVSDSPIVSIKATGEGTYYDISVPGVEHYFAEGAVHHNSQKTYNFAGFCVVSWLCDPANTSILLCSTTTKAQKQKGWGQIQSIERQLCERNGGGSIGNMVNSQMVWEYTRGDSKNAILVKAVTDGDVNKAAADIQGHHTKNQIVWADEAEAIPPALSKAAANLYSYPEQAGGYFLFCAMANARSRLSWFGRLIEPAAGWSSVSVNDDGWTGRPQLDGKPTKVLIFNFKRSPNILAGRVVSKHIPTAQRVAARMKYLQQRGKENDPDHYCYDLGFPAPEGLTKARFSETFFEKFRAYERQKFSGSNFEIIGALDPAYSPEGDRPALRFGALGDLDNGVKGLEWCDPIILSIDAQSKEPPGYQLAQQVIRHCASVEYRGQKVACKPANFGLDVSGDARVADILTKEWVPGKITEIIQISFQGVASETPVPERENLPASKVYANKRSEMYWTSEQGISSGQIKGVDKDTAAELCSIEEIDERSDGTMRGRKTLMSKKEYRRKYTKSCDLADCAVMLTEVAMRRGFALASGVAEDEEEALGEEDRVRAINAAFEDADFSEEGAKAQARGGDEEGEDFEYAYGDD